MTSLVALRDEIEPHISAIPDFPKKGILFRDIMPLFRQPQLVDKMCRAIAAHVREKYGENGVDAVAALDARGFLFGPYVAILLNVPFVPMRKSGKLPGEVISASYKKEYGE
ncbi:Protein T19B4.3, partial [Aphelenchoides avenae]